MDYRAHDLIRFTRLDLLVFELSKPAWLDDFNSHIPCAVVRRAPCMQNTVPIGLRGSTRGVRAAACIHRELILECITPEDLAAGKRWRSNPHLTQTGLSQALDFVDALLSPARFAEETQGCTDPSRKAAGCADFTWGPAGSAGFELASEFPVVTDTSDLDLIIRMSAFCSLQIARELHEKLQESPIRIDALLEFPEGAISLSEYARGDSSVVMRTTNGPRLLREPWGEPA